MKKIGITGGIGSGKTVVSNVFRGEGFSIIDADVVARQVVEPGRHELEELKNVFGVEIMQGNALDRKKLGQIVFSDSHKRKILDSILQPAIRQAMLIQMDYFQY
ncbi:MAG: dephospho-CoA kinase, partial [Lactobacillaceae bacterium]|nr:dephospho-CoA kinase [Lactobacillaceae bacterium]